MGSAMKNNRPAVCIQRPPRQRGESHLPIYKAGFAYLI